MTDTQQHAALKRFRWRVMQTETTFNPEENSRLVSLFNSDLHHFPPMLVFFFFNHLKLTKF